MYIYTYVYINYHAHMYIHIYHITEFVVYEIQFIPDNIAIDRKFRYGTK